MNREDAAREIDNTACCFSDKRFRDAMHMAAAALRGPQPDPETGLVPCGCGGKAKYINSYYDDVWMYENYVGCPDCYASSAHISTSKHGYSKEMETEIKLKLKDNWNTAMGLLEVEG